MISDRKPGRLRRLASKIPAITRAVQKNYHHRTVERRFDEPQIEHRMSRSLYRKAAADLGLEAYDIGRVFCIAGKGKRFRIWVSTSELDNHPLSAITEDKVLISALFREHGIHVPEGRAYDWRDQSAGIEYALSLGRPCVVKPASDTTGGKGVTTLVTKRSDIARAFRYAGLFAENVLIEEFISGDNYRFLIYKGKCISVLRRELPEVTGNGASTVRELVEQENRNRIKNSEWSDGDPFWMPIPINASALRHLNGQGFNWNSVPPQGEKIHLSGTANFGFGCTYSEVLRKTHPDQIRAAEEATGAVGMIIAGVDIVSPDIEAPAYHILEINTAPGIEIHYAVRNPKEMTDPIRTILTDYFEIGAAVPEGERALV